MFLKPGKLNNCQPKNHGIRQQSPDSLQIHLNRLIFYCSWRWRFVHGRTRHSNWGPNDELHLQCKQIFEFICTKIEAANSSLQERHFVLPRELSNVGNRGWVWKWKVHSATAVLTWTRMACKRHNWHNSASKNFCNHTCQPSFWGDGRRSWWWSRRRFSSLLQQVHWKLKDQVHDRRNFASWNACESSVVGIFSHNHRWSTWTECPDGLRSRTSQENRKEAKQPQDHNLQRNDGRRALPGLFQLPLERKAKRHFHDPDSGRKNVRQHSALPRRSLSRLCPLDGWYCHENPPKRRTRRHSCLSHRSRRSQPGDSNAERPHGDDGNRRRATENSTNARLVNTSWPASSVLPRPENDSKSHYRDKHRRNICHNPRSRVCHRLWFHQTKMVHGRTSNGHARRCSCITSNMQTKSRTCRPNSKWKSFPPFHRRLVQGTADCHASRNASRRLIDNDSQFEGTRYRQHPSIQLSIAATSQKHVGKHRTATCFGCFGFRRPTDISGRLHDGWDAASTDALENDSRCMRNGLQRWSPLNCGDDASSTGFHASEIRPRLNQCETSSAKLWGGWRRFNHDAQRVPSIRCQWMYERVLRSASHHVSTFEAGRWNQKPTGVAADTSIQIEIGFVRHRHRGNPSSDNVRTFSVCRLPSSFRFIPTATRRRWGISASDIMSVHGKAAFVDCHRGGSAYHKAFCQRHNCDWCQVAARTCPPLLSQVSCSWLKAE